MNIDEVPDEIFIEVKLTLNMIVIKKKILSADVLRILKFIT